VFTSSVANIDIGDDVTFIEDETGLREIHGGVELDHKEIAFVNFYVGEAHFSADKAYKMATGVEGRTVNASRWAKKPHIQRAIRYRLETMGATAEAALAELTDVAFSDWRDHIDVKMRNGEIISTRMDLSSKVRANELILKAHGKLDGNPNQNNNGVVINIVTPGIKPDDLA
jgi:phage terminase small subunit